MKRPKRGDRVWSISHPLPVGGGFRPFGITLLTGPEELPVPPWMGEVINVEGGSDKWAEVWLRPIGTEETTDNPRHRMVVWCVEPEHSTAYGDRDEAQAAYAKALKSLAKAARIVTTWAEKQLEEARGSGPG